MKSFILVAAIAVMTGTGSLALSAPCKDAAGKTIRCPRAKAIPQKACKPTKAKPCGKYRTKVQNPATHTGYKW
ncbi:hypothetical protein OK349_00270 [Sphingomonas sp. BT-65]|uniref:hypothetical protein n=1 Tax=Sphingomonas sp. BT-65 TaxID=2989821 RepID=UPI002235E635|nr:hypothetical protein [Sphingomonas sp. BT-65]MCW4460128.1 hypothetical protein [Sphingomonas sp. BT-65]